MIQEVPTANLPEEKCPVNYFERKGKSHSLHNLAPSSSSRSKLGAAPQSWRTAKCSNSYFVGFSTSHILALGLLLVWLWKWEGAVLHLEVKGNVCSLWSSWA